MDSKVRQYCKHIRKVRKEVLRKDYRTGVWYWDLPAVAVICYNKVRTKSKTGYSHSAKGTCWNHVLYWRLSKLGEIGKRTRYCRNPIGNCAEQHAGNNFLNAFMYKNINDLYFSESVRPRTMEIIPPCDNCKSIFPNL